MSPVPARGELLERFRGRRVLVIGDVILDRYWHGSVSRISPEAPVPVVHWHREEFRAGGAANVVANVAALGASPTIVSAVGADAEGRELAGLLRRQGLDVDDLLVVEDRPTPVKTRVLARHQHVLRIDREESAPLDDESAAWMLERARRALPVVEALVVSDYAKGLLDRRVLGPLLAEAASLSLPIVIDPKIRNFSLYGPATVITPNEAEAARATALETAGSDDLVAAARKILDMLDVSAVLMTRGEAGMLLVERGAEEVWIAGRPREVFDVTGAGDTVAATLAVALAAGLGIDTAARWANLAGSLSVGRLGTAAVTLEELAALANEIEKA